MEEFETLDQAFENGVPWYDDHGQVLAPSSLDLHFDLNATTMPMFPRISDMEKNPIGERPLVKTFYEGPTKKGIDKHGNEKYINWVEKQPLQVPAAAKLRYDEAAIQIFQVKDTNADDKTFGGLTPMKLHSITIQSSKIIAAIEPILAEVGIQPEDKDKIKIMAPFEALYFAHPKIVSLVQRKGPHARGREDLEALLGVMDDLFSGMSHKIARLQTEKRINWEYLWTLFPKDMIVYTRKNDHERLYQVVRVKSYSYTFNLECRFVQFDGVQFGMDDCTLSIDKFSGSRLINKLPVYPVGFHPDPNLEKHLAERGNRTLAFQDIAYREYSGVGISLNYDEEDEDGLSSQFRVAGRVVIDTFEFGEFNPDYAIAVEELEPDQIYALSTVDRFGVRRRPSVEEQNSNKRRVQAKRQHLLLMSPLLPGFSLSLKKWLWLFVDSLHPISWNESAYDHLVFPMDLKNLLLAFVRNHKESRIQNDDVIAGKGQGLVVLLSGPPGTGKTLTAESVADKARRPLYYLHPESLGEKAGSMGQNLKNVFDLATKWNAIVLIDEADTFLTKRSLGDNSRNEMVSVVLHHLEYFQGIIFLTTNLLPNIDTAYLSRVHIHLRYPALSTSFRLKLWEGFLLRLRLPASETEQPHQGIFETPAESGRVDPIAHISMEDLNELAQWLLNGREIKNVVKTAYLWCSYNQYTLTRDRLKAAISVTAPFAEKITSDEGQLSSNKRQRV